ncbi:MAG: Crp/Fnr family transcriptional regulator [Candidatus Thiodiazotropha sp. (ex Troendleina suluensis)]|nr:Crp/Fnr family transcriptional regulator [Candidatus Thiodiazotropha sp. (ex Troendleina suluensis)]
MTVNFEAYQSPETACTECPIRKMALFKNVPWEQLGWTQNYRSAQGIIPAKTFLYSEGEEHEFVYTLFEGCVKLYKTLDNGKIQAMRFALPGDFLGFQGDLTGPMHHGAQTMTKTVLCAFPKEQVSRMLCERPEIASELIMKNARVMAVCQEHLLSTGARNARERIAFTLIELNHRMKILRTFQPADPSSDDVYLPLTQEDLADAVGLTPIHVNRTLKQLKEVGLIYCGKGKITVLKEKELSEIAKFDPNLISNGEIL